MVGSDKLPNPEILHFPWNLVFPQDGPRVSEFGTQSLKH